MSGCVCGIRPRGTGRPDCVVKRGVSNGLVLGLYQGSDGTINKISGGETINNAFVLDKLDSETNDYRDVWYMTPRNYRVVSERPEDKTEDVEGIAKRTGERSPRKRTFELLGKDATPQMLAALESLQCRDLGFYDLVKSGAIWGTNDGAGNLLMTKIEDDTFMAIPTYATDGTIEKIMCTFTIDETELDSDQDYITSASIDYATKYWYGDAPLEVKIVEIWNYDLDTIEVELKWFRNNYSDEGLTGFVSDDFNTDGVATAYNVTTSTSSAVVAVESENPDFYTLTLGTPASENDVVKIDIVKAGYIADSITVIMTAAS